LINPQSLNIADSRNSLEHLIHLPASSAGHQEASMTFSGMTVTMYSFRLDRVASPVAFQVHLLAQIALIHSTMALHHTKREGLRIRRLSKIFM
jgi:hypothetical protein